LLKIRLRRVGKKRTPYYRVVVAQKEAKRDGAFLETLGSYDPHANPPTATLDEAKTREWLTKGAQPSEAAEKVLRRVGILEAPKVSPKAKVESPKGKAAAPKAEAATAAPAAKAAKAEAPAVEAEAALAAPATEALAEAAVEGTTVEEKAQEPGEDEVSAEAPTVE
jgi:small subunit ribosomal protein S16